MNQSERSKRFSKARVWLWLNLLALFASVCGAAELTPAVSEKPSATVPGALAAASPWDRVFVIGASASAGFTESEPLGGPNTPRYRLSRYLNAAITGPHQPVKNLASSFLFMQPEEQAKRQIDQALQGKPSLVVGLDLLFWFCYGDGPTDAERMQRFEKGLKMVEAISCPLVLGDIPDASAAADSALEPRQIPSRTALAAANRRLAAWAAGRKQVSLVPLADFMKSAMANRAVTVHGRTFEAGKTRAFLQSDKLHPSALGSAVLAVAVLDAFKVANPSTPSAGLRWDAAEILDVCTGASAAVGHPQPSLRQ